MIVFKCILCSYLYFHLYECICKNWLCLRITCIHIWTFICMNVFVRTDWATMSLLFRQLSINLSNPPGSMKRGHDTLASSKYLIRTHSYKYFDTKHKISGCCYISIKYQPGFFDQGKHVANTWWEIVRQIPLQTSIRS